MTACLAKKGAMLNLAKDDCGRFATSNAEFDVRPRLADLNHRHCKLNPYHLRGSRKSTKSRVKALASGWCVLVLVDAYEAEINTFKIKYSAPVKKANTQRIGQ